ncbi:MAG: PstS family phosphate ABC transporter substrate-binding protein [Rhizobiales bacterium]|nr:PstS family phosphate ABC transporter substrate-binding protein [Hyphomicrobiales bacterium]NRB14355.1 PstS family phosphate ABC transporter substrate-binding protein [Hyphomicrobiales bacterium]
MKKSIKLFTIAAITLPLLSSIAIARDQIQIVGSSTVFPFSSIVAEKFGKSTDFKTPVVESTGTGGGMKLFCAGIGERFPDIANASRRIKPKEIENCAANGIDPVEIKVGFDGIVLANASNAAVFSLTKRQIYMALAAKVPTATGELVDNPYVKWSDIDPSLPALKIEVLGPPPTSGTRDAFVEIAMEGGAKTFESLVAIRKTNKNKFKAIAHSIREDGAYIEAGENDNLIVQKLKTNHNALGIFGFSFLDQNRAQIKGAIIDGAVPNFENIADGSYGISRSLYYYVKKQHVDTIAGLREFTEEFLSEKAMGEDGYLLDKGLIPLAEEALAKSVAAANNLTPVNLSAE